jgi:hypothetical protein
VELAAQPDVPLAGRRVADSRHAEGRVGGRANGPPAARRGRGVVPIQSWTPVGFVESERPAASITSSHQSTCTLLFYRLSFNHRFDGEQFRPDRHGLA